MCYPSSRSTFFLLSLFLPTGPVRFFFLQRTEGGLVNPFFLTYCPSSRRAPFSDLPGAWARAFDVFGFYPLGGCPSEGMNKAISSAPSRWSRVTYSPMYRIRRLALSSKELLYSLHGFF